MDGAIFPLNNIFIDGNQLSFTAWQKLAMYEFGLGLPGKLASRFATVTPPAALDLVLAHFKANPSPAEKATMMTEWQQMLVEASDNLQAGDQLPGIKRLLLNLYDHYVKIAVFDPANNAATILKQIGLTDYVDLIVTLPADQNPYQAAIEQLSLSGSACIGIGTTTAAIKQIHVSGVTAIGVGPADDLTAADYQVVQVGDLRYPMLQKVWEQKNRI